MGHDRRRLGERRTCRRSCVAADWGDTGYGADSCAGRQTQAAPARPGTPAGDAGVAVFADELIPSIIRRPGLEPGPIPRDLSVKITWLIPSSTSRPRRMDPDLRRD